MTAGEIRSIALSRDWGERKLDKMEYALGYFQEVSIDTRAIVDAYAYLDWYARQHGHRAGKNDLWIAATAVVSGATLLTTDADFDNFSADGFARLRIDLDFGP